MDEEENAATRADAGILLVALQSFSFLCFLGLWWPVLLEMNDTQKYLQTKGLNLQQCDIKLKALETFLIDNRDKLVNNGVNYAKKICNDLGISIERQRRPKKKKQMFGEGSQDSEWPYDMELKREMFSSMDRVIQEITLRFQIEYSLSQRWLQSLL